VTFGQLRKIVASLDLSNFPMLVNVTCKRASYGARISVWLAVRDIDKRNGAGWFNSRICLDDLPSLTVATARRRIRRLVRNAVVHELDECLIFDGRRPFDPHRKRRK
jgi:hypothetical protein